MGSIALEKVTKTFDAHPVIPSLDLQIEDGKLVVFVSPSAATRSTLLGLIAGLEDASGGTIKLHGADVTDTSPAKRQLAMVLQSYALYPQMSVYNNIAPPFKMANIERSVIDQEVRSTAKTLSRTEYLDQHIGYARHVARSVERRFGTNSAPYYRTPDNKKNDYFQTIKTADKAA